MPAEQRIIGGGLLIFGVAIVLILIFFFSQGGMTAQEAHAKLMDEVFPTWLEAEKEGDYLKQKRTAEEALATLKDGGKNGVIKMLQGATTDKKAQRLLKIVKEGGFEKNAAGQFEFERDWFGSDSHRSLVKLRDAVEGVKVLREIREIAHTAEQAMALARTGSGMALTPAAAKPVPRDDVSVMEPNPIYVHDAELYRVFSLTASDLTKALEAAEPGAGKARSARLRWNKDIAPSNIGQRVAAIPEKAESLVLVSDEVLRSARALADDGDAKERLASFMKTAAALTGAGLAGVQKAMYDENRSKFERGAVIAGILKREAKMLLAHRATIRELGKALAQPFKQ